MELYNLKHPEQRVTFTEALKLGLGIDRGLFFPTRIPQLQNVDALLALPFIERSKLVLGAWLADELGQSVVDELVDKAFNFQLPLVQVDERRSSLELFHGPTLAFKDFGARFMAQCLGALGGQAPLTILTATSGDTGAAVADAFYGLDNVRVMVLYPKGKISELQEKMFTTLGGNIHTVAVESDFDDCQTLVKQAFEDADIRDGLRLNSANSINISRLLAQICYYFEAVTRYRQQYHDAPVIAVPSGNFGNLTAGLLAKAMGLPVKRFIAATNSNDTVPRYLTFGDWAPRQTMATMSNAMDVSEPSNWPRVEAIFSEMKWPLSELTGVAISEQQTHDSMVALKDLGYQAEPHAAVAAEALNLCMKEDERGIFLATAHPAKFKDVVDRELGTDLALPPELQRVKEKPVLSATLPADFAALKTHMLSVLG
ncbi:threonine synthase [Shewanella yunxiaonensis]|uniref:Threonine synthase n=1 Tax=Shewanella yunxiaonensis TaxID=2829809 RepID=A0ABX7YQA3_9GAMM|nr:threonine synthase [Shewanella yunxiaonensis]QUN04917.1 threonine synthase [Shewanella yunxiaonensis]